MKYYSADIVYPVVGTAIVKGVVAMDKLGVVNGLYNHGEIEESKIERFEGTLIPGFINAHCHLELSHMIGQIPSHTGLPKFLSHVMKNRKFPDKEIESAILKADKMMYENGIQAVGDHVNSNVTAKVKQKSPITYHTFVEMFSGNQQEVSGCFDQARDVEFHFDFKHASITPHAPYSSNRHLFRSLKKSVNQDNIFSIHNQESDEENKLFRYNTGEFLDFLTEVGLDISNFKAQAKNSLQTYLNYVPQKNTLILVHNTYTSIKDIDFAGRVGGNVYFCFCPKANKYIENRLPKIPNFLIHDIPLVVGTDSLASNDTLDILEELKVLHREFPELDFQQTIKWATINGAHALNLADQLGSLEVGKRPGLVLLEGMNSGVLSDDVKVRRIR